ncbi:MAG: hypothetical protein GDA56_05660 [Hormoscilla sp. GM7CHS1pb]|nr:hypothetical protein [Hormoscilla sp. GM7CHS1pb]
MLEAKLTPCANLMYNWMIGRSEGDRQLKVDLQDFQAWTGEYREKAYSDREIFIALQQLKQLKLILVAKTEVTVKVNRHVTGTSLKPQAAEMLLSDSDISRLNGERHRQHPLGLVSLVTLCSLTWGLIPIAVASSLTQTVEWTPTNAHPWTVLAEKPN